MPRIPISHINAIAPGRGAAFAANGRVIAVFNDRGTFHAIDDLCPHMGASLAAGELTDGVVTCPWHSWRFRVCDGTWCDNPKIKTGAYPVTVEGDQIVVELPDDEIG